ncbi:MAG: SMEK domain-containing protein [Planctomycetota bacterium]
MNLFFCALLNEVFDWNLLNANGLLSRNQDSFDLFDEGNEIAVQVTTTTDARKIRATLRTFVGRHEARFQRLVFLYPVLTMPKSKADFSGVLRSFDFNPSRDRLCLSDILVAAQDLDVERQHALVPRERISVA